MQKNENRPGYKKTKIGWVPEEWIEHRISDIAVISVGRDLREESFSETQTKQHTFPVYSNTIENKGLYGFYDFEEYSGNKLTIVGRGIGLGTAFARSSGFGAIGRLLVMAPNSTKPYDVRFLAEYVNNRLRIYNESSGIPQLPGESFKKYKVFLPALVEQEAIAEVLECWDKAIRELELKIEKKRNIKTGLMQVLLSGKRRLPGFGTTEDTEDHGKGKQKIPFGWKQVELSQSGIFSKGKGITKDDITDSGVPCIRYGQIYTTDAHIATYLPAYINPQLAQESTRIEYNDLLLAGSGETIDEIGKALAYMGTKEGYAGGDIVIFSAQKDKLRADYLAYYLNSEGRRCVRRLGQGQSVVHIYSRDLKNVVVQLPSLKEQEAITKVLIQAESEIGRLERKLEGWREQKRFLLNNLVTGNIRLPKFRAGKEK